MVVAFSLVLPEITIFKFSSSPLTSLGAISFSPSSDELLFSFGTVPVIRELFPPVLPLSAACEKLGVVNANKDAKPSKQETVPIVSFLIPYLGFLSAPSIRFCSIRRCICILSFI